MTINPYLVGLVGIGVGPSLTPALHMAEGRANGLDYVYRTIDLGELGLAPEQIGEVLTWARALGFDALNVTHPCKQLVIAHLDSVDDAAAALGAVNTVVFDDRRGPSATTPTPPASPPDSPRACRARATANVVLLGAGGAGAAVGHALLELGTDHLTVVDIDVDRATALADELSARHPEARVDASAFDKLAVLLPHSDGVVHCTPDRHGRPPRAAVRRGAAAPTDSGSPTSSTARSTPRC